MMAARTYFLVLSVLFAAHLIVGDEVHSYVRRTRAIPLLPSLSNCSFADEPGWSCSGCNTVRICLPNNVAINHNCGIFLPYCDNGHCTASPSDSCNSTGSP